MRDEVMTIAKLRQVWDCLVRLKNADLVMFPEAIAALDKQIPRKADDKRYFREAGHYIGKCPNCGSGANSEMNYCDQCGQGFDWRSDDE